MNFLSKIISYIKKINFGVAIHHRPKDILTAFYAIVVSSMLTSCFVGEDFSDALCPSDDSIYIQFAIPDLRSILTRASEKEVMVKDIVALVFIKSNDENDGKFLISQSFSTENIVDNTIRLKLGGNVRDYDLSIYLVANPDDVDKIKNVNSIADLRKYVLNQPVSLDDGLPMIGWQTVNTSATSASMSLTRSVAKVSAYYSGKDSKISLNGLQIFHNAINGYLSSPINTENEYKDYVFQVNSPTNPDSFSENLVEYCYPSLGYKGNGLSDPGAFVVVKVTRNPAFPAQYYRINLRRDKDNSEDLEYLDLLANHHYQIEITDVFNDGYDSPEEAAKHPESDQYLVYIIHDHAAEVFSMVTDGMRELGVTSNVILSPTLTEAMVVVKCYDASQPDVVISSDEITYPDDEKSSWIIVDRVEEHEVSDFNKYWDNDTKGSQYEFYLKLNPEENVYEDQTGYITFYWQGLKRTVQVNYEAAFLLPTVCTVELTINGDGNSYLIKDYWTFVTGQGESPLPDGTGVNESEKANTPRLFGIQAEDMSGKKRTGGFHFPMPMGNNSSSPWTYEYTINFAQLAALDDTGTTIDNISIVINGDEFWNDKINWKYQGDGKGILSMTSGNNLYTYAGGRISFMVHFKETDGTSEIIASIYHTGIFHYLGDTKYVDESDRGYYYYEVVPMGGNKDKDFWLDRNIGAKANTPFIDIERVFDGAEPADYRKAAGKLYTIVESLNPFALPTFDFGMIPPGYHIPNQSEWDNIRLNTNFTTKDTIIDRTSYLTTFYRTGNPKIGDVHFQKARYYNKSNIWTTSPKFEETPTVGDAGAGYYWSVTEAPAMEKEEMGNWVRALYLNGSVSTYMNASVTDHRMPIRCKAGNAQEADTQKEYFVSFNVHEATHIFLFDTRNGENTPLYTFPGKAVGTTASAAQWQHFYCSTTVDPDDLRMLFVKLQDDGKVTIYTRNGDSFNTTVSYNPAYLTEDYSWTIQKGKFYDLCEVGKGRENNISDKQPSGCVTETDSDIGNQDFELEYPDEEILMLKKTLGFENWSSNSEQYTKDKFDWTQVKVGAVLKFYTMSTGGGYDLQIFDGQWSQIKDIGSGNQGNDSGQYHISIKDKDVRVATLTITNEIMQRLRERNGIILQGNNCIFLGFSYIQGNEDYKEPEKVELNPEYGADKEPILWKGEKSIPTWGSNWQEASVGRFNWSVFKAGDELRIYTMGTGGEFVLQTFYENNGWQDFAAKEYRNPVKVNNFDVIKITLNDTLLSQLRNSNGLIIQGTNFILYGITVVKN